jgi:predicted nucleic acid-binding protein
VSLFVIDASIAAKWFIEEEYADAALSVFKKGNRLHAPDFLLLEMDSIICKWIRRSVISQTEGSDLRDALRRYPIHRHPFVSFLDPAFEISSRTGQSVYDCLYIALAAILKGKVVTADRRLYDGLRNGPFKKHLVWVEDI